MKKGPCQTLGKSLSILSNQNQARMGLATDLIGLILLSLNVVAEQVVLVANVEFSIRDDRVGPSR